MKPAPHRRRPVHPGPYPHLMVARIQGESVWHKHDDTDDFVLKGWRIITRRNRSVTLGPGDLFVLPKQVEHRPVTREEAHVLLTERSGRRSAVVSRPGSPRPIRRRRGH